MEQIPSISTTDPQSWPPPCLGRKETSPLSAFALINSSREPPVRLTREAIKTFFLPHRSPLNFHNSSFLFSALLPGPELRDTPSLSML